MQLCVTITTSVWWHCVVRCDYYYIFMVALCCLCDFYFKCMMKLWSHVWLLLHLYDNIVLSVLFTSLVWLHFVFMCHYYHIYMMILCNNVWLLPHVYDDIMKSWLDTVCLLVAHSDGHRICTVVPWLQLDGASQLVSASSFFQTCWVLAVLRQQKKLK